ncbi:MAG: glycosyltransferase family 2 protein [Archaeoglobaceae archaeon]
MRALVVILNKDNAEGLRNCLESLERQTAKICRDFDVLILDGGSKDNSRDVAEGFASKHPCVEFRVQKRLGGTGFARIEACEAAKDYDVVVWGDSENVYCEDYVEKVLKALRSCDVVGGIPVLGGGFLDHAFAWYHAVHAIFPKLAAYHIPGNNRAEKTWIYELVSYPPSVRADDYGFSLLLMKKGLKLRSRVVDAKVRVSLPKNLREVFRWQKYRAKGAAQAAKLVGVFPYDSVAWVAFLTALSAAFVIFPPFAVIFALLSSLLLFAASRRFLEKPRLRYFFAPLLGVLVHSAFCLLTIYEYVFNVGREEARDAAADARRGDKGGEDSGNVSEEGGKSQ